jgi:hypothetical protein
VELYADGKVFLMLSFGDYILNKANCEKEIQAFNSVVPLSDKNKKDRAITINKRTLLCLPMSASKSGLKVPRLRYMF